MNQDYELQEDEGWDIYGRMHLLIEINPWAWQSIGAVSGLVGGILSPVLGTLLTAVTWFIHSEGLVSSLNTLSIVSFVLTIPLLAFGAHCLDLLERKTARLSLLSREVVSGGYRGDLTSADGAAEVSHGQALARPPMDYVDSTTRPERAQRY